MMMKNTELSANDKASQKTSLLNNVLLTIVILGVTFVVSSIMGCSVPFR
jgi:hypothetical protein